MKKALTPQTFTYETRYVLAGAYKGKRASLANTQSHTVEIDAKTDNDIRVLCEKVKLASVDDRLSHDDPARGRPSCAMCLRRDPRFK